MGRSRIHAVMVCTLILATALFTGCKLPLDNTKPPEPEPTPTQTPAPTYYFQETFTS
jgi:hypothetical protein